VIDNAIDAVIATNAAGYITAAAADTIVDGVISTAVGAGGVIDNAIDSLISTHSDLFTGVHGVSAGYRLTYDVTEAPDVSLRIYALVVTNGLAPDGVIDNAIDAVIATHDALAGAHGGALGIANDAHSDAATAQSTANDAHADAATAISDASYALGVANAATTVAEAGNIAHAEIENHEDNRCVNYASS
jgi:hypothetical protein